jgi:hypothetical protein
MSEQSNIDKLTQQILGQGLTNRWSGAGHGSAEANARDIASILDRTGVTDIKQFGRVPEYSMADQLGLDANGNPRYGVLSWTGVGEYDIIKEVDPATVVIKNGRPYYEDGFYYGNKITGERVPQTYDAYKRGDFFGGTYAGKGQTGYGIQTLPDGTPLFYTSGSSSNTLKQIMGDMGPVFQIGMALATGGLSIPQQIAANMAVGALSGEDLSDVIKNAAISLAVANVPGSDIMKEVSAEIGKLGLDDAVTNTLKNAAQNAATSATRAFLTGQDVFDAALKGAAMGGVNGAVGEIVKGIPGFDKLTPTQQKMAANAVTGVISGKPMDQILVNSAIAAANAEIHGSKTTAGPVNTTGVDKTTIGNFEDTEITRLEKLGYTKDQIKEYFKGLDNLTQILDEPPTTLPVDNTTKPADADADVKALEKSGLPTAADTDVLVTAPKGPDGYTDAERESKRLQDLLAVGGDGVDTLTITGPRPPAPPPDEHVFDPTYGGIFKPKFPDPNELLITDKRPPAYLPTDNDFPPTPQPSTPTLPTATAPPAAPPAKPPASQAPTGPSVSIDPVKALQEFYNPFTPTPVKSTPSQTDTGPIQLMTDVFGTNIATAQKAAARGYGFSAGGDIDELLRLLRS